jgi:nucleoside-triphosphatase
MIHDGVKESQYRAQSGLTEADTGVPVDVRYVSPAFDTQMKNNLLLTGPPGCGKTTVVMRTVERLGDIRAAGFYTREVRKSGSRTGFDAVGLSSGQSVRLASVQSTSRIRVGRYGVELLEFESLLAEEMGQPKVDADLVVIDEIGKMECFSSLFVDRVRELLDGPTPLLATVALKGSGLIAEVKRRPHVTLVTVTDENRNRLPQDSVERFASLRRR